eukprot:m.154207 g.154207  ORF g.154207 m.154207 type:complete len:684 (+) comp15078_c0_seq4:176-2227(+)
MSLKGKQLKKMVKKQFSLSELDSRELNTLVSEKAGTLHTTQEMKERKPKKPVKKKSSILEEAADATKGTFEAPLKLETETAIKTLNVLRLDGSASIDELAIVNELNKNTIKVDSDQGPGELDQRIAVLSYRWDIQKPKTLKEMAELRSKKAMQFLQEAKGLGFIYAWVDYTCVPQFADEGSTSDEDAAIKKKMILKHIMCSRNLYENCSVFVVDLMEVYPGIRVPTMDFQTRLWINAEKSAVLSNPHVFREDYIKVDRVNHVTMGMALLGSWSSADNSLKSYHEYVTRLLSEHRDMYISYLTKADAINIIVFNIGYQVLQKSYPGLVEFFTSRYTTGKHFNMNDNRHENLPPPISAEEQERLIQDYYEVEPNKDPNVRPGRLKRIPQGLKNPHIKALMDEINANNGKMTKKFSYYNHYQAILLLASEVFYEDMATKKFDSKCYEHIMIALGEHPTTTADKDAPHRLKTSFESDFLVIKKMLFQGMGTSSFPCTYKNIEYPEIPIGHEFHVQLPLPRPIDEMLNEELVLHKIDAINSPATSANQIMLSVSISNGSEYPAIDIMGEEVRVTLQGECLVIWANASIYKAERTTVDGKNTLGPQQVFLNLSLSFSDCKMVGEKFSYKHEVANFFRMASNVNLKAIQTLMAGMRKLLENGWKLSTKAYEKKLEELCIANGVILTKLKA